MVVFGDDTIPFLQALKKAGYPDSADYKFIPPGNWGKNLSLKAKVYCDDGSRDEELRKLVDNEPYTAWTAKKAHPSIVFKFEKPIEFNRIVIFNRYTDAWGTGGGCNSVKKIEISAYLSDKKPPVFIDTFNLTAPRAICFKLVGKGQICTFIPNKNPDIFEIPKTKALLIKFSILESYYKQETLKGLKLRNPPTTALSEIMLFNTK